MSTPFVFINRKDELKYLIDDISIERNTSRLLLISGKTGIGKTELVNKAFSKFINGQFRVFVPFEASVEFNEGYFLKEITKVINKNAVKYKEYQTITSFIKTQNFYKAVTIGVIKSISKYLGIKQFEEGYKKTLNKGKIKDWISDDKELLQICYNYLISILKKQKILIALENFQKIDKKSLSLINELLLSSKNAYFVAEYTIKNSHFESDSIFDFMTAEKIDLNRLIVEKIPKKELVDAIVNEKDLIISILQDTYDQSDGNLHKFKLLKKASNSTTFDISLENYDNVTKSILNSIDAQSTLLFAQIDIHAGSVKFEKFKQFLKFNLSGNIEEIEKQENILNDLVSIGLLKVDNQEILINHDSISIDFKKISKFEKIQLIVSRYWIEFYKSLENQPLPSEEVYVENLLWQIHFLLKIRSYNEISEILQKLSRCIAEGPYNNIINYIDIIASTIQNYNKTKKNIFDTKIIKWIVVMYYQCGFQRKIVDFVSPDYKQEPVILLCFLASMSTMSEKHDIVMQDIKNLKNQVPESLKLGLILVEIRTLRSSYKLKNAKKLWVSHYNSQTFKNTSYEAAFLKYASLVFHDKLDYRIQCLKFSSEIYEINKNHYGIISTYNTLGRDYTYKGNLKLAKSYFNKAEEISSKTIYPKYQLYNNISTLDIVKRKINQRTIDRLNNALDISTNEGDKLIISSNLLCIFILKNDEFYGRRLFNNLKQKVTKNFNPNSLISQICLYNCWKYAIMINDVKESINILENYLKKMNFYRHPKIWEKLLNDSKDITHSVITNEVYPHFIIDWEVDYYSALNNY